VRVWVRVRQSLIAGKGVFAAQDIKQGTRILQYIGERISKAEAAKRLAQGNVYLFALNDRYAIDGKLMKNTARYVNHSCEPNCVIQHTSRTIWVVARRDIQEGEELSYNYGYEPDAYETHPCTCGAKNWEAEGALPRCQSKKGLLEFLAF
jgi:SET domain-containing protein